MWKDPVTGMLQGGIAKTSYSHDALIDIILANPAITQNELAATLGYTPGWISQVIGSDAFQAALALRKDQIVDPMLRGAVEESFKGLVLQSMERLRAKLEANPTDQLCLEVFKNSTRALGYGSRVEINAKVQHSHSLVGMLASLPPATRMKDVTPAALPEAA
jgi:hypothetical protein